MASNTETIEREIQKTQDQLARLNEELKKAKEPPAIEVGDIVRLVRMDYPCHPHQYKEGVVTHAARSGTFVTFAPKDAKGSDESEWFASRFDLVHKKADAEPWHLKRLDLEVGDTVKVLDASPHKADMIGEVHKVLQITPGDKQSVALDVALVRRWFYPSQLEVVSRHRNAHAEALKTLDLKPGDVVKVERKCKGGDGGWDNSWPSDMDYAVGKEFAVTQVSATNKGVYLSNRYEAFPAHCLSLVCRKEDVLPKGLSFQEAVEYLAGPGRDRALAAKTGGPLEKFTLAEDSDRLAFTSGEDYIVLGPEVSKTWDIVKA